MHISDVPPLRYDCVIEAAQELGWRIVCEREKDVTLLDDPECDFCNVYWIDVANIAERMSKLRPWQSLKQILLQGQMSKPLSGVPKR